MPNPTIIHRESTRQLTAIEERALIQAAFDRTRAGTMRARLAPLLLVNDAFDDLIALLSPCDDLTFAEELALAEAYLARESDADSRRARAATERAASLAQGDRHRSLALALAGKVATRLGEIDAARALLDEALLLDPQSKDACKRLAALDFAADRPADVLARTAALAAQGAGHARLFAARALAHARLGDVAAAHDAIGFDAFHSAAQLAPPPGWDSIAAFNAALTEELLTHPGLRYDRYGTASEQTWRIDAPATRAAPLVRALLAEISAAIARHIERIAGADHPWAASRPETAMLRSWCVISESDGFESWHVHQFGWMSGVYYVRVPESISHGDQIGGCLAFGLPEDLAGQRAADAYGAHVVRPREGSMLLFPSQAYHRTFPHGSREKRICLAFDLRPH